MSAEINVRLIHDHNHILVVLQNIFDIRKILCNSDRRTLAKNYEGSSVKEAYVKVKDEAKIYKIIILTQDGQETETILNEKGEAVKE